MVKNAFKFTKEFQNCLTNKKDVKDPERIKDTDKFFNDVAFSKQGLLFHIERYIYLFKIEAKKEDVKIMASGKRKY